MAACGGHQHLGRGFRLQGNGAPARILSLLALGALGLVAEAQLNTIVATTGVTENLFATAQCAKGMQITQVLFAYYGGPALSAPSGSCNTVLPDTTCRSETAFQIISSSCVGTAACKFKASDNLFGVPCTKTTARYLTFCVACRPSTTTTTTTTTTSAGTNSTSIPVLGWQDYQGLVAVGGDVSARCGDNGGLADRSDVSLAECRAFCASDIACGGFAYQARGGYCSKKCSSSVGTSAIMLLPGQPEDLAGFVATDSNRVTSAQLAALPPTQPSPSAAPTASPSQGIGPTASPLFGDGIVATLRFTPTTGDPSGSSTTPSFSFYTVPSGAYSLSVSLWGAGGASVAGSSYGGAGAYVSGLIEVTPGELLRITVGTAGEPINGVTSEVTGGGGKGGPGASSGGGYSAIARKDPSTGQWTPIVLAAGGGAASYAYNFTRHGGPGSHNGTAYRGGDLQQSIFAGGELSLDPLAVGGGGASLVNGGRGVLQNKTAPGAAAASGSALQGGSFCPGCSPVFKFGASGGGGLFGGGSGSAGGGGGSSLMSNLLNAKGQTAKREAHWLAAGRDDPGYLSGFGDRDCDGLVVIRGPPPCDDKGACYRAVTPGTLASASTSTSTFTWDGARTRCRSLGSGWDFAAFYSPESWSIVRAQSCGNQIPEGSLFWLGLRDLTQSQKGLSDAASDKWSFSNGVSNEWFRANARTLPLWPATEPNQLTGSEYCVESRGSSLLNDEPCDKGKEYACCQYAPQWIKMSATSTPTPSVTTSPAPCDSKGACYRGIKESGGLTWGERWARAGAWPRPTRTSPGASSQASVAATSSTTSRRPALSSWA